MIDFPGNLSLYSRSMLGICAVLLLAVLAEVLLLGGEVDAAPMPDDSPGQGALATAAGGMSNGLQIPPIAAYREITDRPLFSDTRRPPPQQNAGASAARATQLVGKWKVTGIVVAGESSFAFVEGIRDRKTVRLQLGMPLDGWKLEEVHPDHLVFASGSTASVLQLHEDTEVSGQTKR